MNLRYSIDPADTDGGVTASLIEQEAVDGASLWAKTRADHQSLRVRAEHAARYGANLVIPATELKALLDQLDRAKATLQAIRELHAPDADGYCTHCTRGRIYHVPAPCDTTAALAEAGDPQ